MPPPRSFDITPHPRILSMLGEIVLPQWKCLAELLDNAVDGFLEARQSDGGIIAPQVSITTPTDARVAGQISVRDNGPGMDFDTLEQAARAGWTSHDPINNLGLFGMGFNIATARLGSKTTIWTTRAGDPEWIGMAIDLDQLSRGQTFLTPALARPKADLSISGTEVTIERLKQDQREWFAKGSNRTNISRFMSRTYSTMLGVGQPIKFNLEINGYKIKPRLHCVWGPSEDDGPRSIEHPQLGTIYAFQEFNFPLAQRDFCIRCWNWLGVGQVECPQCGKDGNIKHRPRCVRGWIGLQRFLDISDYGIDFLRNGRKIEVGNKDLFDWYDESADVHIPEYPIDDPRKRGRFVGEIHLDHCRVPYTKDRFVREDTAWGEMVELVRGLGPIQPEKARDRGFPTNDSPLYKLFQAYRRSTPHNKKSGGWRKLLMVEDNDIAVSYAKRFDAGEADYQSDAKWWELAKQADEKVLTNDGAGGTGGSGGSGGGGKDDEGPLGGDGGGANDDASDDGPLGGKGGAKVNVATPPSRTPLPDLSQLYFDDSTMQRFEVKAFAIAATDPGVTALVPWAIWRTTAGPWEFLVRVDHPIFSSVTMTPLDALLTQLAAQVSEFAREHGLATSFAQSLASLRSRYAKRHEIDRTTLSYEAERQLRDIADSIVGRVEASTARGFFESLGAGKDQVLISMAKRGVASPQNAVDDGRYLRYSPPSVIRDFVVEHLDLFLDGAYWDETFTSLDFGSPVATQAARSGVSSFYAGLLADAVWLAEQGQTELEDASRERLLRASASLQILGMGGPQDEEV